MIPILYEANETAFVSNGIARLRDMISCQVVEERNGVYECDFSYPVDGAHFSEIVPGRIIGVRHDDSDIPRENTQQRNSLPGCSRPEPSGN